MYLNRCDAEPFAPCGAPGFHADGCTERRGAPPRRPGAKSILLATGTFAAALCILLSQSAPAQELARFDPALYAALADVGSSATIAPGTKITLANWQQYKSFMPLGLQEL